jgi:outer membrane receptor protein involved in Fe transport
MTKARHLRFQALVLGSVAMLFPHKAWAQTAPAPQSAPAEAAGDDDQEVVVTAQGRTQRLQDVPISVQVVSGSELVEQNLNSLEDLSRNVPSVRVIGTIGRASSIFIRGVGSGNNPSFDQSVSTFVDGIYHGRGRMTGSTFIDLERVEILRGPQSTFFGNNAIAGAFNIASRTDVHDLNGYARALYGSFGNYVGEGAIGIPITDNFGLRLAGTVNGQDGWLTNVTSGHDGPDESNYGGRATFVLHPSNGFEARLKLEASRNRTDGFLQQIDDCPPSAPFDVPRGFCVGIAAAHLPQGFDNRTFARSPGELTSLNTFESVLTLNASLGEHTLTSISGYYEYQYNLQLDTDFQPVVAQQASAPENYSQLSQELRLASPTGHRFEYILGAYYQTDKIRNALSFNFARLSPTIQSRPTLAALAPFLPLGQTISFVQDENVYSLFGALTWNLTDRLRLSAGLRASWVRKQFDYNLLYGTATTDYGGVTPLPSAIATLPNALGTGVVSTLAGARTDSALMPSAQIQYRITPEAMIYASYARGFKAGGFNYSDISGVFANLPFEPESVDAYEAGLKSRWFDNHLLLNLTLFYSNYSNLQTSQTIANAAGALVSLVRNAASSISQGAELEFQWTPDRHFRLGGSITYLDAHYSDYPGGPTTAFQQLQLAQCLAVTPAPAAVCDQYRVQDLSGAETQNAPDWSGQVTGAYTADLSSRLTLTGEVTVRFSSPQYFTTVADPLSRDDGFTRLDARLTLATVDDRWAFDIIGENLTDETIFNALSALAGGSLGSRQGSVQRPRYFAAQLRFQW